MLIDWKYVYKRRGWSVELIVNGLSEKKWEAFQKFHTSRGIVCPPKALFDEVISLSIKKQKVEKEVKKQEKVVRVTPRKRTYTRKKGNSGDRGKETKS